MGFETLYPEAARQEGVVTYKITQRPTCDLPSGDVRSYVYSKWLRSLKYQNDFFKLIAPEAYWEAYGHYITTLLAKPESMLRLAVLTEDPDVILGFAVFRGSVLDYLYVHRHQRRLGVGAALMPHGIETITHLTKTGLVIWGNKYGHLKFNPFA